MCLTLSCWWWLPWGGQTGASIEATKNLGMGMGLCHHPVTSGMTPGTHGPPSRSHGAVPPKLPGARGLRTTWEVMGKGLAWEWLSAGGGSLFELEKHPKPGDSQGKQPAKATTAWERTTCTALIHQLQLGLPLLGETFHGKWGVPQQNGTRRNPFWHGQGNTLLAPHLQTLSSHFSILRSFAVLVIPTSSVGVPLVHPEFLQERRRDVSSPE